MVQSGSAAHLISARVALGSSQTWQIDNSAGFTVSGIVSGAFSLTKTGTGTLSLGGANTFNGGLLIKEGTVVGITVAGAFGTGAITIGDSTGSANATLQGGFIGTHTNLISVASGNSGAATITSSAAAIFSGAVTLNTHDLILAPSATAVTLSGGIGGTGDLLLGSTGVGAVTVSTLAGNALVLGGATAVGYVAPTLSFDIGGATTSDIDLLNVTKIASVGTGGAVINGLAPGRCRRHRLDQRQSSARCTKLARKALRST